MNIVFIAPFAFTPKATVSARMLPMAIALTNRGHQVTILIPPYDNPMDSQRHWSTESVVIENMSLMPSRMGTLVNYVALAQQLVRRAAALHPDIVHVFKPVGPGALAMWLLDVTGRSGMVVDNDDWEGPGGWLDVNPYPALQKVFMAWQERWSLNHATAVSCASTVLAQRAQILTHSRVPTTVLPNGPVNTLRDVVQHAALQRSELRQLFGWANRRVVIYAGTIPLNHDLDIAVAAVRDAVTRYPTLRWVIIATGAGLSRVKNDVRNSGIEAYVEYLDFMPHDQLVERLVAADIAVYPYRDTNINRAKCSGKIMDYMAGGLPIVTSDVGMNRVYLENEQSGLLTPAGDVNAFSNALVRLLENPQDAESIGLAAQRRLWQHFTWDVRIRELEMLYPVLSQ